MFCLNPFGTGQCLTTEKFSTQWNEEEQSQSLWNRAMSYDNYSTAFQIREMLSQSLWNRAMSYDEDDFQSIFINKQVSIPLEQGNVLRQI